MAKKVLDVSCGSKMFLFDKNNPNVDFCDIRDVDRHEYYPGRHIEMARYIDVGVFLESGPMGASMFISPDYANGYNDFCRELLKVPAADVEPVRHGRWIFGDTMGRSWMKCSECLVSQSGRTLCFTYCPSCGAKMDLEG